MEQLHAIISVAKKRQWNKIYEVIMKRLVELCVDLKDHRTAKDGLHQYRNTVVNVSFQPYINNYSTYLLRG